MSGRPVWPHGADHIVTVRATKEQLISWGTTGRQYGNRSVASFLAFAGDLTVTYFAEMLRIAKAVERRREKRRQARKAKQEQQP